MLRRDLELLKRTSGRYHAMHISSAGSVELIRRAKADGLTITAEAAPHHLLLSDAACMTYDPNFKMNPPLRTLTDIEALRAGVADGTIDCLATDHAPHSAEEKELEFALAPFGVISLDVALGLYAKALIDTKICDWPVLIERMTAGPAKVLDRDAGTLGRVNSFASKSRNCPYEGFKLKGRAVMTIVAGDIKFELGK